MKKRLILLAALLLTLSLHLMPAEAQWYPTYRRTLKPALTSAGAAIVFMGFRHSWLYYIAVINQGNTVHVLDIKVGGDGRLGSLKWFSLDTVTLAFSSMPIIPNEHCDAPYRMRDYVRSAYYKAQADGFDAWTLAKLQSAEAALSRAAAYASCN